MRAAIACLLATVVTTLPAQAARPTTAAELLTFSGVQGGLVVHLGCNNEHTMRANVTPFKPTEVRHLRPCCVPVLQYVVRSHMHR